MASKKYYAVYNGRRTGVFDSWEACQEQTRYFKNARFKSFKTQQEAEASFMQIPQSKKEPKKEYPVVLPGPDYRFSVSVDAACSGNPGPMEYQGVDTRTGTQFFRSDIYPKGTNNIGEFLAIVRGLRFLHNKGLKEPVFSDSKTAIAWVRNQKVNSSLPETKETKQLWQDIRAAETWLKETKYTNPVYKWDTVAWGEIKADFGRK